MTLQDAGRRRSNPSVSSVIAALLFSGGQYFFRVVNYQLITDALVVSVRRQLPSENGVTAGRNTIPRTFAARFHLSITAIMLIVYCS
jgi:hypothetical protein